MYEENFENIQLKANFHPRRDAIVCYRFESRIGYSNWPTIFVTRQEASPLAWLSCGLPGDFNKWNR